MRHSLLGLLLVVLPALASFEHPVPGEIAVRDVPGTHGSWQEARAIVDAPLPTVHAWLAEFDRWPSRFHDVTSARVVSSKGDVTRVRMHSRIVGTDLLVDIHVTNTAIFYEGVDHRVATSGRIFLTPMSNGRTDVIMQTTAHIGGLRGILAPHETIRSRERAKLTGDLTDLVRLAHGQSTATRRF